MHMLVILFMFSVITTLQAHTQLPFLGSNLVIWYHFCTHSINETGRDAGYIVSLACAQKQEGCPTIAILIRKIGTSIVRKIRPFANIVYDISYVRE